jgi:hypothetical protein
LKTFEIASSRIENRIRGRRVKESIRKTSWRNRVFRLIRMLLIISVLGNFIVIIGAVFNDNVVSGQEVVNETTKRIEFIFWGVITFVLTFGTDYIEKREKMDIPDILEIVILIFIYAGLFLSARFELYYRFWWWDDLLHTLSGVIIGFIGFIAIYKINHSFSMDISPLLVALFSFTFAVTLGVVWEVMEFAADVFLGTANQKWNLPDTEIMMGRPYQGSGLRDTMSDLIVDSFGALFTSVLTYFMYKNEKRKTLDFMKKMIKDDTERGRRSR